MLEAPRSSEMSMRIHCFLHYKIPVTAVVTMDPYTDVSVGQLCGTSRTSDEVTFSTLYCSHMSEYMQFRNRDG